MKQSRHSQTYHEMLYTIMRHMTIIVLFFLSFSSPIFSHIHTHIVYTNYIILDNKYIYCSSCFFTCSHISINCVIVPENFTYCLLYLFLEKVTLLRLCVNHFIHDQWLMANAKDLLVAVVE